MFIAEIDPSQIAVQTGLTSTAAILQLVGGGDAILSIPSAPLITGKILRLQVTGRMESGPSKSGNVTLYFGDSTVSPLNVGFSTSTGGSLYNFAFQFDFAYDSIAQNVISPINARMTTGFPSFSVADQTDIQFVLAANSSQLVDTGAVIAITSFTIHTI